MNKTLLKIQVILSYATIITALIISLFGLGFMSGFYTLFMNGNDEMYTFFKDLQVLNTTVFTCGLTFLVLALFLKPFDIDKKITGIFGVLFTLIIAITNIVNGLSIISSSNNFKTVYNKLDFSILEDYVPSATAFDTLFTLWFIAIIVSVALFGTTTVNFLSNKKKGE